MNRRDTLSRGLAVLSGLVGGLLGIGATPASAKQTDEQTGLPCRCCGRTESTKRTRYAMKLDYTGNEIMVRKLGGSVVLFEWRFPVCRDSRSCRDWSAHVVTNEGNGWIDGKIGIWKQRAPVTGTITIDGVVQPEQRW